MFLLEQLLLAVVPTNQQDGEEKEEQDDERNHQNEDYIHVVIKEALLPILHFTIRVQARVYVLRVAAGKQLRLKPLSNLEL